MGAGRPRGFDVEEALERALCLFLEKGYEGAYLGDLTRAMGINPPSLYAAFGSKEGLFRQVLERYVGAQKAFLAEVMAAPSAQETVERLLLGTAERQTLEGRAPGCLLVQGALACADQVDPIRDELTRCRRIGELALAERLSRARATGDLAPDSDPDALARYVYAVLNGMAVEAASGAGRAELLSIAGVALKAWPSLANTPGPSGVAPA
jgi:AcrR family transcriptional regulator